MGAEHAARPAGFWRWLVVALLLAGLSGCSASGAASTATATTAGQQDVAALWRELVQCVRARLRAAHEACRRLNPDPEGRIHGS